FFRRRIGDAGETGMILQAAGLRRQPGPSLGAATVDDRAATLGRHAGTETVPTGAHKIARLKSTLHEWSIALRTARSSSWALCVNLKSLREVTKDDPSPTSAKVARLIGKSPGRVNCAAPDLPPATALATLS